MNNNKLVFAVLIIVISLVSCRGNGVYGKVTDSENGKPISGASVELSCYDCNAHFSTSTDVDGKYSFPEAGVGNYVLNILWSDPPDCSGISFSDTLGTSGDFLITYAGYGGYGGTGEKMIMAFIEIQLKEGQRENNNLKLACPNSKRELIPLGDRYCESIRLNMQSGIYSNLRPGVIMMGGCDLSGLDFSGQNLRGAYFDGVDISNASFVGADLTDADLGRAYIEGTDFTGAILIDASFVESVINNSNFTGSKVEISQLHQANSWDGIVYPDGSTE